MALILLLKKLCDHKKLNSLNTLLKGESLRKDRDFQLSLGSGTLLIFSKHQRKQKPNLKMRAEFWIKQDAWRTRKLCRHWCQFQCDATRFYHLAQQEKQVQIFTQRHVRHRNPAVWKTSEDASSDDRQQISSCRKD